MTQWFTNSSVSRVFKKGVCDDECLEKKKAKQKKMRAEHGKILDARERRARRHERERKEKEAREQFLALKRKGAEHAKEASG